MIKILLKEDFVYDEQKKVLLFFCMAQSLLVYK